MSHSHKPFPFYDESSQHSVQSLAEEIEKGNVSAQYELAKYYKLYATADDQDKRMMWGDNIPADFVKTSREACIFWYKEAAKVANDNQVDALTTLGKLYCEADIEKSCFFLYSKDAKQVEKEKWYEESDVRREQGITYFKKAVELGSIEACKQLGTIYEDICLKPNGVYERRDDKQAITYYTQGTTSLRNPEETFDIFRENVNPASLYCADRLIVLDEKKSAHWKRLHDYADLYSSAGSGVSLAYGTMALALAIKRLLDSKDEFFGLPMELRNRQARVWVLGAFKEIVPNYYGERELYKLYMELNRENNFFSDEQKFEVGLWTLTESPYFSSWFQNFSDPTMYFLNENSLYLEIYNFFNALAEQKSEFFSDSLKSHLTHLKAPLHLKFDKLDKMLINLKSGISSCVFLKNFEFIKGLNSMESPLLDQKSISFFPGGVKRIITDYAYDIWERKNPDEVVPEGMIPSSLILTYKQCKEAYFYSLEKELTILKEENKSDSKDPADKKHTLINAILEKIKLLSQPSKDGQDDKTKIEWMQNFINEQALHYPEIADLNEKIENKLQLERFLSYVATEPSAESSFKKNV